MKNASSPPARLLWTLVLAGLLMACDSNVSGDLARNTFEAELSTGQALRGSAVHGALSSSDDFAGVFSSRALPTRSDRAFYFTALELKASTGEEIHLGQVHEGEGIASGTYTIRADRDDRDRRGGTMVSVYADADGRMMGTAGTVTLDATDAGLSGHFEITYTARRTDAATTLTGTFSAVAGEIERARANSPCIAGLRQRIAAAVRAGTLTREDASRRFNAALENGVCTRDDQGDGGRGTGDR